MIELNPETCFLIVTHSGNLDVLRGLEYSFNRFEFSVGNGYVLFNEPVTGEIIDGFKPLIVKKESWSSEILAGLRSLQQLGFSRVVLWLDDFYLTTAVNEELFVTIVNNSSSYKYLCLRRQRNSFFIERNCRDNICMFDKDFFYFSCLQVAVWDIEHFLSILRLASNIWDFEQQRIEGITHFEVDKSVVSYLHTVEKGSWKYYTKFLFREEYNVAKKHSTLRSEETNFLWLSFIDLIRLIKVRIFGFKKVKSRG